MPFSAIFSTVFLFLFSFANSISTVNTRFPASIYSNEWKSQSLSIANKLYQTKYFTQTLDHFNYNPQSYQTFQQRYLINDANWRGLAENSPIFIYAGSEDDIEWITQNNGFIFETASYFRALVVFIESESENCYKVIKGSWKLIDDTAKQPGGLEELRKSFKICESYIDANYLEVWLRTAYVWTAMMDYPTPSNVLNPLPAYPVKQNISSVLKRFGSNIIFFNGLRDPWSGGGVLKSISKSVVAIVAREGAHHVDLRFSSEEDPEWLQRVRRKEMKIITRWLKQYYKDMANL